MSDPVAFDNIEISKSLLLKAIQVRASRPEGDAVADIRAALEGLEGKLREGDHLALVGRAAVLLGQGRTEPAPMIYYP